MANEWEGYEAPEGYEYYMPPGVTEPQLRELSPEQKAVAEAAKGKKGKLPDDFPGHTALSEAGINTYAQLRRAGDVTEIPGIGPATAEKIAAELGESNEDEEEPE